MKSITFRPLRRIKKTGKIVVASYLQWYKVSAANYNAFQLIVDSEYKGLPTEEFVYDHKGELLYFFTYHPADVPVFQSSPLLDLEAVMADNKSFGITWAKNGHTNYNMPGADSDGVPTFSHWTADYIASNWRDINDFEPLTVGTVAKWLGWFLYRLENSYLQIGK